VIVFENRANGSPFVERTKILVVNTQGALIPLRERLRVNQILQIKNGVMNEEVGCSVVDISRGSTEVPEVGIGFRNRHRASGASRFLPSIGTREGQRRKRASTTATSNPPRSDVGKN